MAEADFRELQRAFAAHLRDPARQAAPPGLEERRLAIYRELLFNNVREGLATAFPVLRRLHDDAAWAALVRDYYARHRSPQPLFARMAGDFVDYLETERGTVAGDPPFLRELAHYEWVELELSMAEDPPPGALRANPHGDLLAGRPLPNPLSMTLAYDWPVHRIGPDFRPERPGAVPTFLVVYRDRDDEVRFAELSAVAARLLSLIEAQPEASGAALLEAISEELGRDDPEAVIEAGGALLEDLRERGILLGTRR